MIIIFWIIVFNILIYPHNYIDGYVIFHYYISYEHEFVKRGVIGSIFQLLSIEPNKSNIIYFHILIVNIWFLATYYFSLHLDKKVRFFFIFAWMTSPMVVGASALAGRFEFVHGILFMMVILLLSKEKRLLNFLCSILILAAMFIHEIFFFTQVMFVLCVFLDHKGDWKHLVIVFILPIVVLLAVMAAFGNIDDHDYFENLIERSGTEVAVAWKQNTLKENISYTFQHFSKDRNFAKAMIVLPVVFAYLWFYFKILSLMMPLTIYQKGIAISPLAILPLFILGIDWGRWCGLFIMNMIIAIGYLLTRVKVAWNKYSWSIYDSAMIGTVVGYMFFLEMGVYLLYINVVSFLYSLAKGML